MALGVLSISLATLLAARDEAIEHAHDTSRNITAILVTNIARTIESSDHSLLTLIGGIRARGVGHLDPAIRHALMFEQVEATQYVTGMGVMDERAHIVAGDRGVSSATDFSDRDYFFVHRQAADVGLYVSRPYRSRVRNGAESIALSRRISKQDGSFEGVALVAIDIAYFRQLLSKLDVGPHGVTAIVRVDGTLVARNPGLPGGESRSFGHSPTFPRMANHDSGFYETYSPIDGVLRLYTFERIPGTPLIAVVAPAKRDVLASWRSLAFIVGVCAMLVSIAFSGVVWLLAYALRDRVLAQDHLLELSQTDPLTGLNNRRALDEALNREWRRLQHTKGTLSILFIDADHFKEYNDRYGHAQGDRALKRLAACIVRHTRRAGDTAARYGGEEFVVVLPDTSEAGALKVAESIRRSVEDDRQDDAFCGLPPFSISVGFASSRRADPRTLDEFIRSADAALYAAKRAGRNCIVAADSEQV
ncbi:Diguanylate cyclase [Burkholderia multivorans]